MKSIQNVQHLKKKKKIIKFPQHFSFIAMQNTYSERATMEKLFVSYKAAQVVTEKCTACLNCPS